MFGESKMTVKATAGYAALQLNVRIESVLQKRLGKLTILNECSFAPFYIIKNKILTGQFQTTFRNTSCTDYMNRLV